MTGYHFMNQPTELEWSAYYQAQAKAAAPKINSRPYSDNDYFDPDFLDFLDAFWSWF